jgi:Ca-activated chloride channel family protein
MKWGSPNVVILFLLIPALAVFLRARWKARLAALDTFGNPVLVSKLIDSIDRGKQVGKQVLLVAGFVFLILALARPQFGTKTRQIHRKGQDIVIALDLSESMNAEDFLPSRLGKAKQEIKSLMRLLEGDRIGLVVFAGEAQVLCPLTLDYGAAALFLDEVDTHWLPTPGTNLTDAIETGAKCFKAEEQKYKNLILITDGEGHEGDPVSEADKAGKEGVTIYAIGIGKPEGVPIPVLDSEGRKTYKKDKEGNIVTTKLDIDTLQQLAAKTGGRWHQATGGQLELSDIYEEIREQEDKELESTVTMIYEDRFQIPLLIGLILFLLEPCLPDRKKVRARVEERA